MSKRQLERVERLLTDTTVRVPGSLPYYDVLHTLVDFHDRLINDERIQKVIAMELIDTGETVNGNPITRIVVEAECNCDADNSDEYGCHRHRWGEA